MMDSTRSFSSAEACALADITYRQLDYWCRIGVLASAIAATGSGSRRRWSEQQVMVLAVLARVGGHARISELDELSAVLADWPAVEWGTTTLLVTSAGIWTLDDEAPPVALAVNLAAIRREVEERAAELVAA